MRFASICVILLMGVGCKSAKLAHVQSPCAHPGPGDASCPPTTVHHHHHDCKQPDRPAPQVTPPAPVTDEKKGVVINDVLLIPKMVYVPYVPHVPVAPARLSGMMVHEPAPEPKPATGPAPATAANDELLRQLLQKLDEMSKRMKECESRIQAIPCPPPACGPRVPLLNRGRAQGGPIIYDPQVEGANSMMPVITPTP